MPDPVPDLKYLRMDEIRRAICDEVGIETDRYDSRDGFTKAHLYQIATELGDPPDDLTLAELYRWVCAQCNIEYNETAGNQWRLGRRQLKCLYHVLHTQSTEKRGS